MKLHILHTIHDEAWGGGNQFLKALRDALRQRGLYAEVAENADLILCNSFPFGELRMLLALGRLKKKGKKMVHRIDGPISEIRGKDKVVDSMIYSINQLFAEGTIFQSQWSKEENQQLGMKVQQNSAVIVNAPDPALFFQREPLPVSGKIKLIATSWSSNPRKGFDVYSFLDTHLDFSKYEMTFVGNSPIAFKNIIMVPAQSSKGVAALLRSHHIFITASQKDPCSNSLLEALHIGLPAVVRNDGGHPELAKKGGMVFNGTQDVISVIDRVASSYQQYVDQIDVSTMTQVVDEYVEFSERVFSKSQKASPTMFAVAQLFLRAIIWSVSSRICSRLYMLYR